MLIIILSGLYCIILSKNCRVVTDSTCCPFPGHASIFSMSHYDESVPQGYNAVKTWLARALIPLKPAPAQKSSAKQNIVSTPHGFFNVLDFVKGYITMTI